jgi:hypothetical protein
MPLNPTTIHPSDKNTGGISTVSDEAMGPQPFVMWDRFTATGVTAAAGVASFTMSAQQPARSIVEYTSVKSLSADLDMATGSHLGLGIAGDLNEFSETAEGDLESNEEAFGAPTDTQSLITAARALSVFSTNGSGVAAGTIDNCDLFVVVWGTVLPKIKDG